jgi:hypothetical protein
MLTIEGVTDEIIHALTVAIPEATIEPLPIDPEILGSPVRENQIWVAFDSISADSPGGAMVNRISTKQSERWSFVLVLRLFDLYSPSGSYDQIERVRDAVTGLASGDRSTAGLYMQSVAFREFAEGLFLYRMSLVLETNYLKGAS